MAWVGQEGIGRRWRRRILSL